MESRTFSIITDPDQVSSAGDWKNLSPGKAQRSCKQGDKRTFDTRYFISSRRLDIETFSGTMRNHWKIVNCLPWVRDIVFKDEERRARERDAAANLIILKHITLNRLKSLQAKLIMRVGSKLGGSDEEYR